MELIEGGILQYGPGVMPKDSRRYCLIRIRGMMRLGAHDHVAYTGPVPEWRNGIYATSESAIKKALIDRIFVYVSAAPVQYDHLLLEGVTDEQHPTQVQEAQGTAQ